MVKESISAGFFIVFLYVAAFSVIYVAAESKIENFQLSQRGKNDFRLCSDRDFCFCC